MAADAQVFTRLEQADYADLQKLADRDERSVAAYVRRLILADLAEHRDFLEALDAARSARGASVRSTSRA